MKTPAETAETGMGPHADAVLAELPENTPPLRERKRSGTGPGDEGASSAFKAYDMAYARMDVSFELFREEELALRQALVTVNLTKQELVDVMVHYNEVMASMESARADFGAAMDELVRRVLGDSYERIRAGIRPVYPRRYLRGVAPPLPTSQLDTTQGGGTEGMSRSASTVQTAPLLSPARTLFAGSGPPFPTPPPPRTGSDTATGILPDVRSTPSRAAPPATVRTKPSTASPVPPEQLLSLPPSSRYNHPPTTAPESDQPWGAEAGTLQKRGVRREGGAATSLSSLSSASTGGKPASSPVIERTNGAALYTASKGWGEQGSGRVGRKRQRSEALDSDLEMIEDGEFMETEMSMWGAGMEMAPAEEEEPWGVPEPLQATGYPLYENSHTAPPAQSLVCANGQADTSLLQGARGDPPEERPASRVPSPSGPASDATFVVGKQRLEVARKLRCSASSKMEAPPKVDQTVRAVCDDTQEGFRVPTQTLQALPPNPELDAFTPRKKLRCGSPNNLETADPRLPASGPKTIPSDDYEFWDRSEAAGRRHRSSCVKLTLDRVVALNVARMGYVRELRARPRPHKTAEAISGTGFVHDTDRVHVADQQKGPQIADQAPKPDSSQVSLFKGQPKHGHEMRTASTRTGSRKAARARQLTACARS